ncbi:hypothetical protein E2C01_043797 [Portunus trituberculatus]|uniref:Uncharacterized protein n=1 Tax=Portunus trituberculatus TaxID=210409 RepID=A0A5B7FXP2_PORTR|nr:hypothetical protein [Portunus trituberculatus]
MEGALEVIAGGRVKRWVFNYDAAVGSSLGQTDPSPAVDVGWLCGAGRRSPCLRVACRVPSSSVTVFACLRDLRVPWSACGGVGGVSVAGVPGAASPRRLDLSSSPFPGKSSHRDAPTSGESERDTTPDHYFHAYL